MRPRRITDAQIAYVIDLTARRREAFRKLAEQFPTNAEIAKELHCCVRVVDRISAGEYSVSHGTSVSPTQAPEYAQQQIGGPNA